MRSPFLWWLGHGPRLSPSASVHLSGTSRLEPVLPVCFDSAALSCGCSGVISVALSFCLLWLGVRARLSPARLADAALSSVCPCYGRRDVWMSCLTPPSSASSPLVLLPSLGLTSVSSIYPPCSCSGVLTVLGRVVGLTQAHRCPYFLPKKTLEPGLWFDHVFKPSFPGRTARRHLHF